MILNFYEKADTQLQTDVMSELKWDPSVSSEQISISAKDGVVTLRGSVPHHFEKTTAEKAAERVGGVRAIADELEVSLLKSSEKNDQEIARAALAALEWNYQVPDGIKVTVDHARITLRGRADWDYQRSAAENSVNQLMGVRGVINEMTIVSRIQAFEVKNRIQAFEVKKSIQDALKRSAESEGRNIRVDVSADKVTLSGDAHSLSEIETAGFAAWSAPGVCAVENNMKIMH